MQFSNINNSSNYTTSEDRSKNLQNKNEEERGNNGLTCPTSKS